MIANDPVKYEITWEFTQGRPCGVYRDVQDIRLLDAVLEQIFDDE